jgi:hypothetical protein
MVSRKYVVITGGVNCRAFVLAVFETSVYKPTVFINFRVIHSLRLLHKYTTISVYYDSTVVVCIVASRVNGSWSRLRMM